MISWSDRPGRTWGRILIGIGLLLLAGGILAFRHWQDMRQYEITVIPPTCTENGYSLYTHKVDGTTTVRDITTAAGHRYGQWSDPVGGSDIDCAFRQRSCEVCDFREEQAVYPETDFPRMCLYGSLDGIGKQGEVSMTVRFEGMGIELDCSAALKYQGHSTLNYDKKSYTIKLYSDDAHTQKNKLVFSHWNPEHKYILKANYMDATQARNLVCADIWAAITACRDDPEPRLKTLSNYGAVDGFPIVLYINDSFQGLYTLNLHKDDDLFGMDDGRSEAIMILNSSGGDEACFRAEAVFSGETPWEVEFCGTADDTWARDKLNQLIRFVRDADNETFRRDLGKYLDVESAIDYLIAMYALGLTTSGTKDLVLVTYGKNEPWIASMYDMENAFGLLDDGISCLEPQAFLPERSAESWDSGTGGLLWDRLLENFLPQIRSRYTQLRQTILEPASMQRKVSDFISAIPDKFYQRDKELYRNDIPVLPDGQQINMYLTERIQLLDVIFLEV